MCDYCIIPCLSIFAYVLAARPDISISFHARYEACNRRTMILTCHTSKKNLTTYCSNLGNNASTHKLAIYLL